MDLLEEVNSALTDVIDPELGINIVDLGLVYGVRIDDEHNVMVTMTLTTPGCPMHDSITNGVKERLKAISEIGEILVNLVWDPAWSPTNMTDRAKKMLWG